MMLIHFLISILYKFNYQPIYLLFQIINEDAK